MNKLQMQTLMKGLKELGITKWFFDERYDDDKDIFIKECVSNDEAKRENFYGRCQFRLMSDDVPILNTGRPDEQYAVIDVRHGYGHFAGLRSFYGSFASYVQRLLCEEFCYDLCYLEHSNIVERDYFVVGDALQKLEKMLRLAAAWRAMLHDPSFIGAKARLTELREIRNNAQHNEEEFLRAQINMQTKRAEIRSE